MFWALVIAPFVVLGLAALIAGKGPVVRLAAALGGIFVLIDAFAFWELLAQAESSTGSIGLGLVGLLQLVVALALLIYSPFARKARARTNSD